MMKEMIWGARGGRLNDNRMLARLKLIKQRCANKYIFRIERSTLLIMIQNVGPTDSDASGVNFRLTLPPRSRRFINMRGVGVAGV